MIPWRLSISRYISIVDLQEMISFNVSMTGLYLNSLLEKRYEKKKRW